MHLELRNGSRSKLLLLGLYIVGSIFIVRLFYLQVIQNSYYEAQAAALHKTKFVLQAERGEIYARDGKGVVPLVLNEPVYLAFADPQAVDDVNKITATMKSVAGGQLTDFQSQIKDKDLRYVVLAKNLSKTQADLIKKEDLAGVGFTKSERRVYPEGQLASQLLGFVNTEGQGQNGIEQSLQNDLAGKNGELKAVTDVRQIPLTIGEQNIQTPAKNGEDLVLSIDRNVQAYAEKALKSGLDRAKASEGSVLVMNPNNGQVLAMANYPTYDPSKYGEYDDFSVFTNKTVTDPYEAGSVIKTLTMGVGLDSGAVGVNDTFNNTGFIKVDDTTIKNVEEDPINPAATMTDILHYSLNTGVVYILEQMGGGRVNQAARDKLYDYFSNHFMFGKKTGIEQAGEQAGTIIGPEDEQGNNVRYSNMVFGQGMDVTMLQAASAFSASINGGVLYQPTLVSGAMQDDGSIKDNQPHVIRDNVLKPAASIQLRDMTIEARQLGAFKGKDTPGYQVGGKTGTSQRIDPKTGKYTNDLSIGSYLGFGGQQKPEYVIMIRVNDSRAAGYAGTTAAGPIFTDISNWMLDYMNIEPR